MGLFFWAHYQYTRQERLNQIDQELIHAAYAARAILGADFHDQLSQPDSVSHQADVAIAIKLYDFAQSIGMEYLYSLKKFDDQILFTTSSATEEEFASNDFEPAYFSRYPEMDEAVERAFENDQIQFAQYSDRWGSFRSVYIPFHDASGEIYVMAADVAEAEVEDAIINSLMYALAVAGFFVLLLMPIFILFYKSKKRVWRMKYQLLFKDSLTGLPNKNQLLEDLESGTHINLALIDIKRFRDIISNYGPAISDDVLRQFAMRLGGFSHDQLKNHKIYKLDGDVFAIYLDRDIDVEIVKAGSEELINHLTSHKYTVNEDEFLRLNVYVGGVNQNEDAFVLANMALAEAKRQKNQSFVYDQKFDSLPLAYKKNSKIKQQLIIAIEQDRLVPHFQPIFDAQERTVVKFECLARIVDEQGQVIVSPQEFIPVAKQSGLYAEMTQIILTKSIEFARNRDEVISVNLSISDIMNNKTRPFIYRAVSNSGIASRIQFEILETEAIEDLQKVRLFIRKLQKMGAQVGVDDLGRSYSNFDRLANLPLDFIKIDGSIITSIGSDQDAQHITREIIRIAKRHQMKVTAECCFDQSTTNMASRLGVDYLQGFYLGEPKSGNHF